jgi:hypothetical protein
VLTGCLNTWLKINAPIVNHSETYDIKTTDSQ